MELILKTDITNSHADAFEKLNENLFRKLNPKFVDFHLDRFDGVAIGDEFHFYIGLFGICQKWIGQITDVKENLTECYFIDEGVVLPSPLLSWKHKHRIIKINETHCQLIDEITYTTGNKYLDLSLYPSLFAQFQQRKKIYKEELSKI